MSGEHRMTGATSPGTDAATAKADAAPAAAAGGADTPLPTWPARLLMLPVRFYRLFLRAWLGTSCRFEPTCSTYAMEALARHGAASGAYLTVARLVRCHPWCDGGLDPVPDQAPRLAPRLFTRLISPDQPKKFP